MGHVIELLRRTAAHWAAMNTILSSDEAGFEIDTGKLKIGDGRTRWNALQYVGLGAVFNDGIVVDKATGIGIKIDAIDPSFGWRDITAALNARATGPAVPTYAQYNGTTIYQHQFSNATTQEIWVEFHIPHDYVPGSDIYIHAHWSQTSIDTGGAAGAPGVCKWSFDALYAQGHQQQAFPANVTTVTVEQAASGVARQHMIAEVKLSTDGTLGNNVIVIDGVILVRVWRNPNDAADTLNQAPFLHFCDLHYQSTNVATKNKAPDFYA